VAEAGGWRVAAPGCVGGGDGFSGAVAAGGAGEETGVCFGRAALAAGVGCTATGVTGTIGVATAPEGREVVRCEVWCPAFAMVGA